MQIVGTTFVVYEFGGWGRKIERLSKKVYWYGLCGGGQRVC